MLQRPQAGTAAPDFALQNQTGETLSLKALRGQYVLLYFYPKALTPGCTTQACGLRDSQSDYLAHNVRVLGLSPDPVSQLQKFADKHSLNFDLLSDPDHAVADAYGVWGPKKFMGREYDGIHRVSFLIDPAGQIAQVFDKVKTKSHHQDVLDALMALQQA